MENAICFNRGADGQLSEQDIEEIDLDDCSIIHFGSATAFLPGPLQQAYKSLLQKRSAKIFLSALIQITGTCYLRNNTESFIEQIMAFH